MGSVNGVTKNSSLPFSLPNKNIFKNGRGHIGPTIRHKFISVEYKLNPVSLDCGLSVLYSYPNIQMSFIFYMLPDYRNENLCVMLSHWTIMPVQQQYKCWWSRIWTHMCPLFFTSTSKCIGFECEGRVSKALKNKLLLIWIVFYSV